MEIYEIKFVSCRPKENDSGLIGFVSCTLNRTIRLDSIAVRRTLDERLTLSFPSRRDSHGIQRFYYRPLDNHARREIEFKVFGALGINEEAHR